MKSWLRQFSSCQRTARSVVPLLLRRNEFGARCSDSRDSLDGIHIDSQLPSSGDRGDRRTLGSLERGPPVVAHPDLTPVADLNLEAVLPADEGCISSF